MKNKRIVKPFAPEIPERQVQSNRKESFQQIVGNNFRSWLKNSRKLQAERPSESIIVGSKDKTGYNSYEVDNLPQDPQYTAKTLINILKQDSSNYHEKYVDKRDSEEKRLVKAPFPQLKQTQRLLLEYLYQNAKVAEAAHGFVPKKGNWTAAAEIAAFMKTKQKYSILTQDLRKAFDSITEQQVRTTLEKSGLKGFQLHAATRIATYDGKLATGSPSSPYILNILFKEIDEKLENWAKQHNGIYIRYADDISFALPTWNTKKIRMVRELVRRLFRKIGIELHSKKTKITRLGLDSDSAEVIGLAVQHQKATRPKRLRNRLRGRMRQIRKQIKTGQLRAAERTFSIITGLASYFAGEFRAIKEAKTKRILLLRFSKT
jgi:RNA-directed DNA polymerase